MQGIYASRTAQSIRSEEKSTIPFFFFFFISFCPWNALSRGIVSLAARCVSVCCNYYRAQCVRWLEIDLNKDSEWGGGERENKEVFVIYGETKRGGKKRGQGERAAWACFACTGASVGEGVDRAPQCCLQLSDNSCSERRDVLRVLRHVSLFPHLSFSPVCLSPFSPSRHTPDTCATRRLPHIHTHPPFSMTHTHTHTHTHAPTLRGRVGCEIHKKLAGCLRSNKNTQNKPGEAEFLMGSAVCSAYLESCLWRIIIGSLMEMKYSSSLIFRATDDRHPNGRAICITIRNPLFFFLLFLFALA